MTQTLPAPTSTMRRARAQRLIAAALAVIALSMTSLLSAAPAEAAIVKQCTGTIKKTHTIQGYGRVEVWYSPKNGGTNCVMVYDLLAGSHYMQASIHTVNWSKEEEDKGTYQYYAGGAQISGVDGKCVEVDAFIQVAGPTSFRYGHWGPYLCGAS